MTDSKTPFRLRPALLALTKNGSQTSHLWPRVRYKDEKRPGVLVIQLFIEDKDQWSSPYGQLLWILKKSLVDTSYFS